MAFKDIFGFERATKSLERRAKGTSFSRTVNAETLLDELARIPVSQSREVTREWHDTLRWGEGLAGSVRLVVSPLGSLKATVRKLVTDSTGQPAWICKRVYPLNLNQDRTAEDWVAVIREDLKTIMREEQDGSQHEMPRMDKFAVNLAGRLKQHAPSVFVYKGLKKMEESHYIAHFEYRGQGVEAPGARRCEEFCVSMSFKKDRGLLNVWGYEVSSPTRQHRWEVRPAEWNEYFVPTQNLREVMEAVVNLVRSY